MAPLSLGKIFLLLIVSLGFLFSGFFVQTTTACNFNQIYKLDGRIGMANGSTNSVPSYKDDDHIMDADHAADISHGVSFGVPGSTMFPYDYLATKNILNSSTTTSFSVQLDWLDTHLNSICPEHRDCAEKLNGALFFVGDFGANDYKDAILQGKTMDEIMNMVPDVVNAIMDGVRKVIGYGATRVVVSGILPIGCLPIYKTVFQTNDALAYDDNQCLNQFNELATWHNDELINAVYKITHEEKPNAYIVYGNYYDAYIYLHTVAKSAGYDTERACCGIGGIYNFDMTRMCGDPDVPICEDPGKYISWDGVHLTGEGYRIMAKGLDFLIFPLLQCHLN